MTVEISLGIIALCMLVITLGVVPILLAVRRLLVESQRLVEQVRLQAAPLVHDATQIAGDIRTVVKTLEKEMPKVSDSLDAVRGTATDIRAFETMLRERVERPLLDLTSIIAGIAKGLTVFWKALSKS